MTEQPFPSTPAKFDPVTSNQHQVEQRQTQYEPIGSGLSTFTFPLVDQEFTPIHVAKLVVIGEPQSGKTTLITKLLDEETVHTSSPNNPLDGHIQIRTWKLKRDDHQTVYLNSWEFSALNLDIGAELLFNKNAIYMVVLDGTRSKHQSVLRNLLDRILRYDNVAPIVVVTNKVDLGESYFDQETLRESYSQHIRFVTTSCQTGYGIDHLRHTLDEFVRMLARQVKTQEWAGVYEKVARRRVEEPLLALHKFFDICTSENVLTQEEQFELLTILDGGGSLSCYRNQFNSLRNTIVLDPNWLLSNALEILWTEGAGESHALIHFGTKSDLPNSNRYHTEEENFAIELMVDRGLCIRTSDNKLLVPNKLPIGPPFTYNSTIPTLTRRYYFSMNPQTILWALMARYSPAVEWSSAYRAGVQLSVENCEVNIEAEPELASLDILIVGRDKGQRKAAIAIVANALENFSQAQGIQVSRVVVPLPHDPNVEVPLGHLQTLSELGEMSFIPYFSKMRYSVDELLAGKQVGLELTDIELYQRLSERMSPRELEMLCDYTEISDADMNRETVGDFARSIVRHCRRRNQIGRLIETLKLKWPHVVE